MESRNEEVALKTECEYYLINYKDFVEKYLFSEFLGDFTKEVISSIVLRPEIKENRDLVEVINSFVNATDLAEKNTYRELIDEEFEKLGWINSQDEEDRNTGLDFVDWLYSAILINYSAGSFIEYGKDYFEIALKEFEDGYDGGVAGFKVDKDICLYFADFFRRASNWCVSDYLNNAFNNFIMKYGVGMYFTDILLDRIMFNVLNGKIKLSKDKTQGLIRVILNSNLISDEKLAVGSNDWVNELMRLADKVSAPQRMKKLILSKLASSSHESVKISCCNYIELGLIDYSSDSSERVRGHFNIFKSFFSWWNGDDIKPEVKEEIAKMASEVSPDVLKNVYECDEEYVMFDFPFLKENGVFKIAISLYQKYMDIFEYATDVRFLVVFIRELFASGQMVFVPDENCRDEKIKCDVALGKNPIRQLVKACND